MGIQNQQRLFILGILALGLPTFAQDYPYEENPPANAATGLPVESPDQLAAEGKYKKRTSLFRMGLKGGGNYSYYQTAYCVAADATGCLSEQTMTLNGFGAEGRLAFGWDMAFQPIYLETEIGYRGLNFTSTNPLHVVVLQQGLYFRERLSKTSMWKPGILSTLDLRVEPLGLGETQFSVFPSIGVTSLWEFSAFLIQATAYFHRAGSGRIFVSTSALTGIRF
jgi:hypothetical protein